MAVSNNRASARRNSHFGNNNEQRQKSIVVLLKLTCLTKRICRVKAVKLMSMSNVGSREITASCCFNSAFSIAVNIFLPPWRVNLAASLANSERYGLCAINGCRRIFRNFIKKKLSPANVAQSAANAIKSSIMHIDRNIKLIHKHLLHLVGQ